MRIRNNIYCIFFILIGLFSANMTMAGTTPLPANQAFVLSVSVSHPDELRVEWRIAPKYYLYVKQLHMMFSKGVKADIHLPQGELQYDPVRGRFEAYAGYVNIPVFLHNKTNAAISMQIQYQGCSHEGFCYPPMHQDFSVNLTTGTSVVLGQVNIKNSSSTAGFMELLTDQNKINMLLSVNHFTLTLFMFVCLGLLLAFTPCILPMVPVLTSIIVGQTSSVNIKKAFFLSLSYVLGTAATYAIAGWIAASMGGSLQLWLQRPWAIGITSSLFVLLSLSLFGLYELCLPKWLQHLVIRWTNQQKGGSYVGVFCMGMLSTLIVSPCVTAPLIGVLMYIGQTGDKLLGVAALFAMGIGMGIPLLLIGMSAGRWLPKTGPWMVAVKQLFGMLMLAMAIWILSRVANETVVMIMWGSFLLGMAVFLVLFLPRLIKKESINRLVGLAFGLSSMLVMFAAVDISPISHYLKPRAEVATGLFTVIRNVQDFNRELLLARARHQPVLLDFYADWCESCITMDTHVFNATTVKQALLHYRLLRVDLTANNENDQALLKFFNVIAPPTMLFFDETGMEVYSQRMVGELNAKEFLKRLQSIRFLSTS